MATQQLSQQEIKLLEQTRQRLSQLTNSIGQLHQQLVQSDPLPNMSSIHTLGSIIAQNLTSACTHLSKHDNLFNSMPVYPLPAYPGQTQEGLLNQLLRKKLEPAVEDRVASAVKSAISARDAGVDLNGINGQVWEWAGMAANEQARRHVWGGDYTQEEIEKGVENVATGLKRKLRVRVAGRDDDGETPSGDDGDEDEEKDDPDAMEVVSVHRRASSSGLEIDLAKSKESKGGTGALVGIKDHFKYLYTGQLPPL